MDSHRLSALFSPESVALLGATERSGSIGRLLLEGLRAEGFKGRVGAVNPKYSSVLGEPCVARVGDLDFAPDVALAAVPPEAMQQIVADCAARGTRFVVRYGRGFDLSTEGGRAAEAQLQAQARAARIHLIGPDCTALMRPSIGLEAGFAPGHVNAGRVAMLSESGTLTTALIDWAVSTGMGFSSILSLGRSSDLEVSELLDFYLHDALTDSVLLYLETVRDARRFMSSLRALARVKPVVILRGGLQRDRHTRDDLDWTSLADADRVMDAAIARAGAVRAKTSVELLASARLLSLRKRPRGGRLTILANGAGPGTLAADAVSGHPQLSLATLGADTRRALDALLPGEALPDNPVNLFSDADASRIEASLRAVLSDAGVDAALVVFVPQAATPSSDAAGAIVTVAASQAKPLAAVLAGGGSARAGQRRLDQAGVPQFLSPEHAIDALALLERFARNQASLRQVPGANAEDDLPDLAVAEAIGREVRGQLHEQVSAARPAHRAALSLAEQQALEPRTDAQGHYRLTDAQAHSLARAFGIELVAPVALVVPDGLYGLDGIDRPATSLSEGARDAFIGVTVDPCFGAVIAFGSGGPAITRIDDMALELPPLNANLARALISRTRLGRLLEAPVRSSSDAGFGQDGADTVVPIDSAHDPLDALTRTLMRVSALVCACPWVVGLQIDPLRIAADGRVTAQAVRIQVSDTPHHVATRGAYPHLAIHPYPRELEEDLVLRTGQTVRVRPIRPEDADLERLFVSELTPQSLYRRFMIPVKSLPDALIERFTQIDYDQELALVAIEPASVDYPSGRLLAIARVLPTAVAHLAEFAIVVGDWLHKSGLGHALMHRLIAASRARGYTVIEGTVLAENFPMLAFCASLGFTIHRHPDDPVERIVRLELG